MLTESLCPASFIAFHFIFLADGRPWILFGDGTELRYYDTENKTYDDVVFGEGRIQSLDFGTEAGEKTKECYRER